MIAGLAQVLPTLYRPNGRKRLSRLGRSSKGGLRSSGKWNVAVFLGCIISAIFIARHLSSTSGKISQLASALKQCKNAVPQVLHMEPDPVAGNVVYVAAPCNDTATAGAQAFDGSSAVEDASALAAEVKELRKKLGRKDDVLRVRNNQLAEISRLLDERESLWNASLARLAPSIQSGSSQDPPLIAVLAVVSDYESAAFRGRLRKAWYPGGSPKALEDCLGVRIVFVMGSNPWQESDGTGVTSDTEAVREEEQQWGDFLRVPAVHQAGSEGRSRLMHDMWRRLPLQHDAKFYIKANANALPNPRGLVRSLMQYNESQPAYIGCMKAGPVVNDWKSPWYEPQGWKFGGSGAPGADRFYMLHASANGYALTRAVAMHIAHFGDVLAEYNNEDIMVGSWMLGLNVEHTFDSAFCCGDMSVCHATGTNLEASHRPKNPDDPVPVQERDCEDYIPGATASANVVPEVHKVCAMFGGGCNGICGVEDNEAEYLRHAGCPRVV